jgi:spore coat protein U-like protein
MINKKTFSGLSAGIAFAGIAGLGLASLPADASGTATATFQVSLTVTTNCSISANPLAFGSTNSALATTAIAQSTSLSVTCNNGASYTLSLDKGTTTGSTVTNRLLAGTGSNTQTVQYELYSDSGHSTIWGDSTGGSTVSGTGTGAAQTITVYGQVPSQTVPTADTYTSTETATVSF